LNRKLSRLYGLLGLIPCRSKSYNHKLHAHLSRLVTGIYLNSKRCGTGAELLRDLEGLPPKKAIYKLQLKVLRILKKTWQQQKKCLLAGG